MTEVNENAPVSNAEIFWVSEAAFRSPGKNIEFNTAFLEFQRGLKAVTKDSVNPFFNSLYASLDAIMQAVLPKLTEHGLIITQAIGANSVVTTITHAASGQFYGSVTPILIDQNNKKNTESQRHGSGATYARRYALGILGITTQADDDAAGTGEQVRRNVTEPTISREEADAILADAATIGKDTNYINAAVEKAIGAGKTIYDLPMSRLENLRKWLSAQRKAAKTEDVEVV